MTAPLADGHRALIYLMVMMSAADGDMSDNELAEMNRLVTSLPVFEGLSADQLPTIASDCVDMLSQDDGLTEILSLITAHLPVHLRETAYTLACDIAAADGLVVEEEARLLDLLRDALRLDGLVCAALERASRARHLRLEA